MGLENCVEYKGNLYCWNPETESLCMVIVKDIKTENCPPEAIKKIMCKMSETAQKGEKPCLAIDHHNKGGSVFN